MSGIATTRHATFAQFALAGGAQAIGTRDELRAGVQHIACIDADVSLSVDWIEAVAAGAQIQLRVIDRPDLVEPLLAETLDELETEDGDTLLTEFGPLEGLRGANVDGLDVFVETETAVTYHDGTSQTFTRSQMLTCIARERVPGGVVLTLASIEDRRLATLIPARTYRATDFPALYEADAGRAVPYIYGIALKLAAAQVTTSAPYRYVICEPSTPTVLTVYRGKSAADARVVDPSEYTVGAETSPFPYRYIEFSAEQRDFDGSRFAIFADVQNGAPYVHFVIDQILTSIGATLDATSYAAAATFGATNSLFVDCDFGREGQRQARAVLEDLLYVMRGTLSRNASAEYVLTIDDDWKGDIPALDEDRGDDIEVLGVSERARPTSVGIAYRPRPDDAGKLQHIQTRNVSGGSLGPETPRELRYVRSHSVADRCAYYRAVRAELSARLRARIYRQPIEQGQVIAVTSREFGLAGEQWRVRDLSAIEGGFEIEAEPYTSALFTYVAGTLQGDAGVDYSPDYSDTPPLAPSGFRITATATALAGDGTLGARVTADAFPPSVNWAELWIAAIHNTTSEITLAQASAVGGGRYGCTLTGLRPGEVYQLKAYAVNAYAITGVVQGTFDATAIGGGGAATTFTTAGYATVPANVASCTAVQGTGRLIEVSWPAVTTANLREYVLERRIGAGAYSEVWRGQSRQYLDRFVSYGSTYQYRVRALDTYGNFSAAYATSSALALAVGTIVGGGSSNDIGSDTVASVNRTGVSTGSTSVGVTAGGGPWASGTIAHGLGRVPIATIASNQSGTVASVTGSDSSNIGVAALYLEGSTGSAGGGGGAHTHTLGKTSGLPLNWTVAADYW